MSQHPTGSEPEVLYEVADHIATITLNAPGRLNTISGRMLDELSAALLRADRDRDVRCIVLTSGDIWHVGGTRAFTHAAVYATPSVSELLDQPLAVDAYQTFMPEYADDFADLALLGTRTATHLIDAPAVLTE